MESVQKNFVHLVGDSTLDNLFWLSNDKGKQPGEVCIEGKLKVALGDSYTVVNHAWDGFTTDDVLQGGNVGVVLGNRTDVYNYALARGKQYFEVVHPLETLEKSIREETKAKHYVVISVGGNDFRTKLSQPWALLSEDSAAQERYFQILDRVQGMGDKNVVPILMFQYRTDLQDKFYQIYEIFKGLGLFVAALNTIAIGVIGYAGYRWLTGKISRTVGLCTIFLGALFLYLSHRQLNLRFMIDMTQKHIALAVFENLLNRFYAPMMERAERDNLSIIYSDETLDPYNPFHYIQDIEPSEAGGEIIAGAITNAVKGHSSS